MTAAALPGVGGTLFPARFLQEGLPHDAAPGDDLWIARRRAELTVWWQRVERQCGPATGLHAVFDLVAMPLAAMLGFRAANATFDDRQARATLLTRQGRSLALIVRPWSSGPPSIWRHATARTPAIDSPWCVVIAPPYVSVVNLRGHGARRSLDFRLPHALGPESVTRLLTLAGARAFDGDPSRIDRLVSEGLLFQDRVREDLQRGVADALAALTQAPHHRRNRSPIDLTRRFDEALTIVYRILFLLFAESRDLVPHRHAIYQRAYTIAALCRDALTSPGPGTWDALAAVTRLLRVGCRTPDLIVSPFNGELFARQRRRRSKPRSARPGCSRLPGCRDAPRARRARHAAGTRRARDDPVTRTSASSSWARCTSASSTSIRSTSRRRARSSSQHSAGRADRHVLHAAAAGRVRRPPDAGAARGRRIRATRSSTLRIVDPAMGSGAFLVAACRYLADAYARALIDEGRLARR